MAVNNCIHVRTAPVNFAMNKTLGVRPASASIDRFPSRSNSMMSPAVTRPGAMLRDIQNRCGFVSWRALTWP